MFFSKYMYSISFTLSHQKIIEIKHVKVSLPILQGWEGKQKTWILRFSMKRLYGGWATSKTTHYAYWSLDTVSYSLFFECGQNTPISMKIIKSFAKRWWQVTTSMRFQGFFMPFYEEWKICETKKTSLFWITD